MLDGKAALRLGAGTANVNRLGGGIIGQAGGDPADPVERIGIGIMRAACECINTGAGGNGPEPGHPREAFRAQGPSNYFHGKQAEDA